MIEISYQKQNEIKKARFRGSGLMFVDKGYQEHEESNKEFNDSQKFPIYGSMLCQIFGQKSEAIHQLYSFFLSYAMLKCW